MRTRALNFDCQDGFQATAIIRNYEKQEEVQQTPIIALTAGTMVPQSVEQLKSLDMDDYLVKPPRRNLLNDCLQECTRKM